MRATEVPLTSEMTSSSGRVSAAPITSPTRYAPTASAVNTETASARIAAMFATSTRSRGSRLVVPR
ncbi:MAG: hypothetical protein J07HX64_01984 [halophilic archaeon J07HX64]|nr:MAG: hypothetical protein J07HX64_01984 [halophilic archaeon J07HX64]